MRGQRHVSGVVIVAMAAFVVVLGMPAARANVYSKRAGFADAKLAAPDPRPITLWKPSSWGIRLSAAIERWNAQAGRTLFERVRDEAAADIDLQDGADIGWATACVNADGVFDVDDAYAHCTIYAPVHGSSTSNTGSLIHEMGHTLGFADHVHADEYRRYARAGLDPASATTRRTPRTRRTTGSCRTARTRPPSAATPPRWFARATPPREEPRAAGYVHGDLGRRVAGPIRERGGGPWGSSAGSWGSGSATPPA